MCLLILKNLIVFQVGPDIRHEPSSGLPSKSGHIWSVVPPSVKKDTEYLVWLRETIVYLPTTYLPHTLHSTLHTECTLPNSCALHNSSALWATIAMPSIPNSLTREEGSVNEVVKQLSQRLPPGSPEFLYLGKNSSFWIHTSKFGSDRWSRPFSLWSTLSIFAILPLKRHSTIVE
jgi:hypothetical protein